MTIDDSICEQQLCRLFASIPPPPAPASWRHGKPVARHAQRRRPFGRPRPLVWQVATIVTVAVAVGGIVVLAHRIGETDGGPARITSPVRPASRVRASRRWPR